MQSNTRGGSRRPQCDEMKHFKKGDNECSRVKFTELQRELSYTQSGADITPSSRKELYKIALSTADRKRPQTLKEIF